MSGFAWYLVAVLVWFSGLGVLCFSEGLLGLGGWCAVCVVLLAAMLVATFERKRPDA